MGQCLLCDGTGRFKEPKDKEGYDHAYDRFDTTGFFNADQCRDKALKEVGYTIIECPRCKGTGQNP